MTDSELLQWLLDNLLTDSQLDVVLPDGRTLRFRETDRDKTD